MGAMEGVGGRGSFFHFSQYFVSAELFGGGTV